MNKAATAALLLCLLLVGCKSVNPDAIITPPGAKARPLSKVEALISPQKFSLLSGASNQPVITAISYTPIAGNFADIALTITNLVVGAGYNIEIAPYLDQSGNFVFHNSFTATNDPQTEHVFQTNSFAERFFRIVKP